MNTTTQRAHAPQHRAAWIMAAFALLAMSHTAQAVETSAQGEVVLVEKRDGVTSVRTVEGHVHQRANVAWTAGSLRAALKEMPKGDVARGKNLHSDMFCASCHGVAGESLSPNWPAINGQRADYTYKMLLDYQSGLREEDGRAGLMNAVAALLSKQDMADLAAYYAAQPLSPMAAVGDAATQTLVRQGDPTRLITPCAACHGLHGQGGINETPALAGLPVTYFVRTMQHFQSGTRHNDALHGMRVFAKPLTDAEITALAEYYAAKP